MYADIANRNGRNVTLEQQRAIDKSVQDLLASSVEAMPGVVPVLSELAKRYKLCVASSSAPCRIAASLNRAALTSFLVKTSSVRIKWLGVNHSRTFSCMPPQSWE